MSQLNPMILQALAAAQQPTANPPLSQDPTAEARGPHYGNSRVDAMGATGMHPQGGRGNMLPRAMPEDRTPARETGVEEGDPNMQDRPVGSAVDVNDPKSLAAWLGHAPAAPDPNAAAMQHFAAHQQSLPPLSPEQKRQNELRQQQEAGALNTPEGRLDNYENMLSQTDPKAAAEVGMKRLEFSMKQQQQQAEMAMKQQQQQAVMQNKTIEMHSKMYDLNTKGTAGGDAEASQQSEQKASTTGGKTKAADDFKLQLLKSLSPQASVQPTAMTGPAQTMMSRLALHQKATPIKAGMQFAKGQFYKSPGTGRVHQHIGNDADGNPLFTPALA